MHSSIYIIFNLGVQLLFFSMVIDCLLTVEKTADMYKTCYTEEKALRWYAELKVLDKNIEETSRYLQTKLDELQSASNLSSSESLDTESILSYVSDTIFDNNLSDYIPKYQDQYQDHHQDKYQQQYEKYNNAISKLKDYQDRINSFIDSNLKSEVKLLDKYYTVKLYKQNNPKLDHAYPNWSWKIEQIQ